MQISVQIKRTPGGPPSPFPPSRKMCEGGPPGVLFIWTQISFFLWAYANLIWVSLFNPFSNPITPVLCVTLEGQIVGRWVFVVLLGGSWEGEGRWACIWSAFIWGLKTIADLLSDMNSFEQSQQNFYLVKVFSSGKILSSFFSPSYIICDPLSSSPKIALTCSRLKEGKVFCPSYKVAQWKMK